MVKIYSHHNNFFIATNKTGMQTLPDYFYERPEQLTRQTTNPRYKFFRQNHYTAGDYEQFLERWDASFSSSPLSFESQKPATPMPLSLSWIKYKGACVHDVFNTYMYISEKFKKDFYQTLEMIKPLPQVIKEEERVTEEEEKREVIPVAVVARTSLGEDEAGGQEDTRSRSISNGKEYTSKKS